MGLQLSIKRKSNPTELFHLHFDRKFDNFFIKLGLGRKIFEEERQVLVETDCPLKEPTSSGGGPMKWATELSRNASA